MATDYTVTTDDGVTFPLPNSGDMPVWAAEILARLRVMQQRTENMALNFDALVAQVTAEEGLEPSILAALQGYAQAMVDAAGDQSKIDALTARVQALVTATTAGTPAASLPAALMPAPTPVVAAPATGDAAASGDTSGASTDGTGAAADPNASTDAGTATGG